MIGTTEGHGGGGDEGGRGEGAAGLRLVPLGVGDAFSERHYSTCLAFECEGSILLVDCPHPVLKMMREARLASGVDLAPDRVCGVVLTHLHADHASGLETLAYYAFFALKRRLRLFAHPAVAARLWEGHLAAGMECLLPAPGAAPVPMAMGDYLDLSPLGGGVTSCGPFELEVRPTVHHIPTMAVRVRAAGRSIAYSADTIYDEALIAWLLESDLVLHETGLGVHTPYASLAALPAESRAKMRLVHYPDTLEGAAIERLREGRVY
ncbi:MAG TPA: MBL fold metallo-hydrolase [Polyangiaceae bacterium]|nr:MBL fold metallo-hydrolase [Polyangiaceae bacterium]